MWNTGLVGRNVVFFDGHERVAFHGVGGSVGEGDARHAFGIGLNQVAFVEGELVIGIGPLDGIDFLDLNFAIEVDEASLLGSDLGHAAVVGKIASEMRRTMAAETFGKTRYSAVNTIVVTTRM